MANLSGFKLAVTPTGKKMFLGFPTLFDHILPDFNPNLWLPL